ncbi:hypothetical protein GGI20_004480 [Coemansia sp. BCRC 34301]|nr:hypothetical protein GGI20_004480 [Coemansia sp. BCRC 34301]
MVQFKAFYFASAREAAQDRASETLQLADGKPATLASAIECVKAKYPKMELVLESAMVALNEGYCDKDDMASIAIRSSDTMY